MQADLIKLILLTNTWFSALPAHQIDALLSRCRTRRFERGQLIYAKDDDADGLFCMLEGSVRVSTVNAEGKEQVLTWFEPGSWFGEISMFDGLPRSHDAHAESSCELLFLPKGAFDDLLVQHPELYPHFTRLMCQRLRALFSVLDEAGSLSLKGRLAKRLLLMASGMGQSFDQPSKSDISVSQESLAHMLNVSRQTINKLLQEIQRAGAIKVTYGKISISNLAILKTLSEV